MFTSILLVILLGFVEGLTEYLPVSSTAHLLIGEQALGFHPPGEVFPIVIQLGAILAVVVVYWRKFWDALIGLPTKPEARQFALGIFVAFLPSAVAGLALHHFIKDVLFNPSYSLVVIATTLFTGGVLILILERSAPEPRFKDGDHLPLSKCFQIGLCQCLALVPGVSRSGATILGGMLLGVERKAGAAFTFYLAVPTMLAATLYDLYTNRALLDASAAGDIALGFVVSFLVAYVVVRGFIGFIGHYGLKPFGWYRIAAGLALFGYIAFAQ
ncbi:MAG TPA: undecaprenyl-diphosphate phosphatase [Parvularculaceae bacterium]|nr:undecaprenyl-diphosphate phosphatase [Parvularculaceae bacterium]